MCMTVDRLADAARAFRAAREEDEASKRAAEEARARRTRAIAALKVARDPLAEEIVAAVRQGVRQRDILARIGNVYTRERIRQICKDAGVDPAE